MGFNAITYNPLQSLPGIIAVIALLLIRRYAFEHSENHRAFENKTIGILLFSMAGYALCSIAAYDYNDSFNTLIYMANAVQMIISVVIFIALGVLFFVYPKSETEKRHDIADVCSAFRISALFMIAEYIFNLIGFIASGRFSLWNLNIIFIIIVSIALLILSFFLSGRKLRYNSFDIGVAGAVIVIYNAVNLITRPIYDIIRYFQYPSFYLQLGIDYKAYLLILLKIVLGIVFYLLYKPKSDNI